MIHVRVRIYSVAKYASKTVRVFFEFTNKGTKPISVLKRNTPLEGLVADCLTVKRNGKLLQYDGLHAKRLSLAPDEILKLEPEQSQSCEIDLSEAYPLSAGGKITVSFKKKNLEILSRRSKKSPVKITTVSAHFSVTKLSRPTIGERHRAPVQKQKVASFKTATKKFSKSFELTEGAALIAPKVEGATNEREKILRLVHEDSFEACRTAFDQLGNNRRYAEWFGVFTSSRGRDVLTVYENVIDRMQDTRFTYVCNQNGRCNSRIAAFTTEGGSTIFICDAFWSLSQSGNESQVGCLVHEHSHASAGTVDVGKAEGPRFYRQLAQRDPGLAVECAYNIEYYAVFKEDPV